MATRFLYCVLCAFGCVVVHAQSFVLSIQQQSVDCGMGEVCYTVQLSSANPFELGSSTFRFFYDCTQVEYILGSANVNNLPPSYMVLNDPDLCVDATGFGSIPFEQNLSFLQIAVDHTITDAIEINSTPSTVLQNMCFDILNPDILLDPTACFDLIWTTELTRENYVNSVTSVISNNTTIDAGDAIYISLSDLNNCFIEDCVDIDDPCIPIVDMDGDGVCDVGDVPDPDPADPCVPNITDVDGDGICDIGANPDPDPADPCIPNITDADGDGVCDIGLNPDPDPTDPCNPDFAATNCTNPEVEFELSFSNVNIIDCDANTICYDIVIQSTTAEFPLGSYNLRIFYDGDLADAIDSRPTLIPSPALNNNYSINSVNDMQGGNQTGNGTLPFDDNLDILDIAVNFTGSSPITVDASETSILHQLCFDSSNSDLLDNPLSCFPLVWVTAETQENYSVGITTLNVASTLGITANLDLSIYNNLNPLDNCFEFSCIEDECSVLACNDNVQISLDSCLTVIDPDLLLEAPQLAPYVVDFFTLDGDFVRTDTLLGADDGQTYQYTVSCLENSCWGTVSIEANVIPEFITPCACLNVMDDLPEECLISCALSRLPDAALSLDEVESILLDCGPASFSDLQMTTTVIDTFCQHDIEVHEIVYSANVERHGEKERVTLLCQQIGFENIPLEGHDFEIKFRFPDDLQIECDLSIEGLTNPDSILQRGPGTTTAFPYFQGPRITTIEERISIIETIPVQTGITRLNEELVSIDTDNDGIFEWVLITEAVPIFMDSFVFDTTFVEVANTFEEVLITDRLCNAIVSFSDTEFFKCGNSRLLFREWTVVDWCNVSIPQSSTQLIEILDTRPPEIVMDVDDQQIPINTINDVQTFLDPWECFGRFKFPELNLSDNCGSNINVVWDTDVGDVEETVVTNIPKNNIPVEVTATLIDECNNETSIFFNVSVLDTIKPVAVCRGDLTVSLTTDGNFQNGLAQINAVDLDGGSGDAGCDSISFGILRFPVSPFVTPGAGTDFASITCVDLGREFTFTLVVQDEARNRSTCEVNIIVQNSQPLDIECEDVVVECMDDRLRRPLIIGDVCNDFLRSLMFNDIQSSTVCLQDDIIREWFLDVNGDEEFSADEPFCTQRISVDESSRFDPFSIQWPKHFTGLSEKGINLECDSAGIPFVIMDQIVNLGPKQVCLNSSMDFGRPIWCDVDCTLIGASMEIDTIQTTGFCMQLINRWTIIDWCTFEANGDDDDRDEDLFVAVEDWTQQECPGCLLSGGPASTVYFKYDSVDVDGFYTFDQSIKVVDDTPPELIVEDIIVNVSGGSTSKTDETDCFSSGTITASVIEFCGDESIESAIIEWSVLYDNGVDKTVFTTTSSELNIATLEGAPGDIHIVTLTATDGCGNSSSDIISVTFIDVAPPTPLCVGGVTTSIIQSNGSVSVWARDFDLGSFDNCDDLNFTIVPTGETPLMPGEDGFESQANMSFTCDDVNNRIDLDVYVWDVSGNSDFCTVSIVVAGDCALVEGQSAVASGALYTESNKPIQHAIVEINSNSLAEYPKSTITNQDGEYSFDANPIGEGFSLNAEKGGDWLNGVSTLDLFLMQEHILGKSTLESAYKVIAADVNNDKRISSADIVDLRNLILGKTETFTGSYNWKFVDSHFQFSNMLKPWPFSEEINVQTLVNGNNQFDFVGIKIGDLNDNAIPNDTESREFRSDLVTTLQLEEREFVENQIIEVVLDFSSFDLYGFQFTLELQDLELIELKSSSGFEEMNFDFATRENHVTVSYFSDRSNNDQLQISLILQSSANGILSESLLINSAITRNEAYEKITDNTLELGLDFSESSDALSLFQNTPNPFTDDTELAFHIPSAGVALLRIVDVTGKELLRHQSYYKEGRHTVNISKEQLKRGSAVMYYQLELNGTQYSEVHKMIRLH